MDVGGMTQQKDYDKQGLSDVLLLLVRAAVEAKAQVAFLTDEVTRLNTVNESLMKAKEQVDVPVS